MHLALARRSGCGKIAGVGSRGVRAAVGPLDGLTYVHHGLSSPEASLRAHAISAAVVPVLCPSGARNDAHN